jgi:hypothetical protein
MYQQVEMVSILQGGGFMVSLLVLFSTPSLPVMTYAMSFSSIEAHSIRPH